jgi:hypothetical protein
MDGRLLGRLDRYSLHSVACRNSLQKPCESIARCTLGCLDSNQQAGSLAHAAGKEQAVPWWDRMNDSQQGVGNARREARGKDDDVSHGDFVHQWDTGMGTGPTVEALEVLVGALEPLAKTGYHWDPVHTH